MSDFKRTDKKIHRKYKKIKSDYVITEKDFYPPEDTRLYCSGIEDIDGGDNFIDYVKYFLETYEEDLFDM